MAFEDASEDIDLVRRQLVRNLTEREAAMLFDASVRRFEEDGYIDPQLAWIEAHQRAGEQPLDLDRSGDRVSCMAERVAEGVKDAREARGEPQGDELVEKSSFDLSDDAQRRAFMQARIEGRVIDDAPGVGVAEADA